MSQPQIIKRILQKVEGGGTPSTAACWIYTGAWNDTRGYKKASVNGNAQYVHRVIYEWFWRRKLRKGVQLDHRCCQRACCNPLHLVPMMNKKNSQLRSKRAKQQKAAA